MTHNRAVLPVISSIEYAVDIVVQEQLDNGLTLAQALDEEHVQGIATAAFERLVLRPDTPETRHLARTSINKALGNLLIRL